MRNTRFNEIRKSIRWAAVTVLTSGLFVACLALVSSQWAPPTALTSATVDVSVVDRLQITY